MLSLVLLTVLAAGGLAVALGSHRPDAPARDGGVRRVARRTARWRAAGVVVGLVVGLEVLTSGTLGRGVLLAAPVCALCVLAGILAGELAGPAVAGRTRQAALEVRRVRDYLPPALSRTVALLAALLLGLLAVTSATASADDLGRAGRSLAYRCGADLAGAVGPWPGSFYSAPLVAVLAVGLLGACLTLRQVVRRPRTGTAADALLDDDAVRRRSAAAVTGACGVLVAVPLAGVALTTAAALLSVDCRAGWQSAAAIALLGLVPALLAVLGWCASAVLAPGGRPARTPLAAR